MPTLVITRGLPGSGKTTWARSWVIEDPVGRARVNRDDTRNMLHGSRLGTTAQEDQVTAVTHAAIRALLAAGLDVVCDDTNLYDRVVAALAALAAADATGQPNITIVDLRHVPVDVCIARDAGRGQPVGEVVIRDMWTRHLASEPTGADR